MKHHPKVFDVAILGAGLGGLVAAHRLVRANRSVLLLKEERFRSSYVRDGYSFIPFSNFSEMQIQTRLLKNIPLPADYQKDRKRRNRPGQNVSFQVILPEARIDLYDEPFLLKREWSREFPKELSQIESFYAELRRMKVVLTKIKEKVSSGADFPIEENSFFKRWFSFDGLPKGKTDQRLSSFSREFKKFIELQMISHGNLCSDSFPISLVSHLLTRDQKDEWDESVDLQKVRREMIEGFIQSGGRIEEIEGVKKAEMTGREGFSLFLKGEEKMFQSRTLIMNSPLHHFSSLFGKKGKAFSKWGKKIQPYYVLIPFFLGIREKAIPVGMRNLLVSILNLEAPHEGGNLLFLSLSKKGDTHQAPEGRRALTAQGLMRFGEAGKEAIADLQNRVMDHLRHLFPFLGDYLEFIDRTWTEDQINCWSYPHYFYKAEFGFEWRKGILPIRISRNLYFTGRENFPYLGAEGEILSGWLVGEDILRK